MLICVLHLRRNFNGFSPVTVIIQNLSSARFPVSRKSRHTWRSAIADISAGRQKQFGSRFEDFSRKMASTMDVRYALFYWYVGERNWTAQNLLHHRCKANSGPEQYFVGEKGMCNSRLSFKQVFFFFFINVHQAYSYSHLAFCCWWLSVPFSPQPTPPYTHALCWLVAVSVHCLDQSFTLACLGAGHLG